MNDLAINIEALRGQKKEAIIASINKAFDNREHNIDVVALEMQEEQRKHIVDYKQKKIAIEKSASPQAEKVAAINDLTIHLGKFKPRTSMAITYDSHDYPFLLEKAWEKIQNESERPIHTLTQDLKQYIQTEIERMAEEEYHHAAPIEGLEQVERCFGVIFFEEKGEYGIKPFMGFGGELSILTYGDVYTAPTTTSDHDKKISNMLK